MVIMMMICCRAINSERPIKSSEEIVLLEIASNVRYPYSYFRFLSEAFLVTALPLSAHLTGECCCAYESHAVGQVRYLRVQRRRVVRVFMLRLRVSKSPFLLWCCKPLLTHNRRAVWHTRPTCQL